MAAAERTRRAAVHGGILVAALCAVGIAFPSAGWPWHLLLPALAYGAVGIAVPALRRTAPRPRVGRLSGAPLAAAVGLTVAASGALLAFHLLVRPDAAALAERLPVGAFGGLFLAGVCFSVVNAA